ncbi:MAG: hypothetical protein K6G03_01320, partial [Lachnospiraceae bacterium]|nr:hypothetical protein [Lachnospiraceae bacterium]
LTDHGLEKKVAYDLLDDKEKNDYDSRLTSMKDNWNEATAESKTDEAKMREIALISEQGSGWLSGYANAENPYLKKEGEKGIDRQIDNARTTFGLSRLSKTQRTKRGKKFNNKAALQANMINAINKTHYSRESALDHVLSAGVYNSYSNKDEGFLNGFGQDPEAAFVAPVMKDVAYYKMSDLYDKKRPSLLEEDKKKRLINGAKSIEKMADPKTRNAEFEAILRDFMKLDLNEFNYKNDNDFVLAFEKKFAKLRAFSNADTIMKLLNLAKDKGYQMPEDIAGNYDAMHIKARVLQDILEDYNNRALLLQSPYYVLLANKDFDSISDGELKKRIEKTEDNNARIYMQAVLQRRAIRGFGKGKEAKKLLEEAKKRQKHMSNEELEKYVEDTSKPSKVDDSLACRSLPYIAEVLMDEKKTKEINELKERVLSLHRALNASISSEQEGNDINSGKLYYKVDNKLYSSILAAQQVLENTRSKAKALSEIEKTSGYLQAAHIQDMIARMLTEKEYVTAREKLIKAVEEMETKLAAYPEMKNSEWKRRYDRYRKNRKDDLVNKLNSKLADLEFLEKDLKESGVDTPEGIEKVAGIRKKMTDLLDNDTNRSSESHYDPNMLMDELTKMEITIDSGIDKSLKLKDDSDNSEKWNDIYHRREDEIQMKRPDNNSLMNTMSKEEIFALRQGKTQISVLNLSTMLKKMEDEHRETGEILTSVQTVKLSDLEKYMD